MALEVHLGEVDRRLYQPECVHSRKRAVEWRHKDLVPDHGRVATALQQDSAPLLVNLVKRFDEFGPSPPNRPRGLIREPQREGGSFAL